MGLQSPIFKCFLASAAVYYYELPPPIRRCLSRHGGGHGERGVHKLPNTPTPVRHAQRLRWRRAEGFVSTAQIVMSDVQRDRP